MPLPSGARLGTYEITHALGEGGMGEVYRARDTKLGRSVAIKVILAPFASDPDRISRFEREAKSLAAINHPNIASLFGLEQSEGQHFLVMELVEGETLAGRIQRGPIEVEHALAIAHQIAEALEAAHEKGIVHRDLKPANIKITPDDKVKVLDFGLAKAMETEASGAAVANSPTLSMMATNAGVILGTAAYMSPEQAKGFAADHRSDVFSFGVVLYEMLTGRQPFQGETAPDILASILVREPELQKLPVDLNPRIPDLIRRCLEKSPKRRWQAIGDVRAEIEMIAPMPRLAAARAAATASLPRRAVTIAAAAIVTGALAGTVAWQLKPPAPREVVRFAVAVPDGQQFTGTARQTIAISPDGTQLVYTAGAQLHLRPVSSFTAKPILGTETHLTVFGPTFSPDGTSIAFYALADRTLKRVAVTGGSAVTICAVADSPYSLFWSEYGIVYGQRGAIMRVSANGGTPETLLDVPEDDSIQRVQMLPGGAGVLYTVGKLSAATGDRWRGANVMAASLKSGERELVVEGASDGWYVPSGHLLYAVGGTVHAVAFDAQALETRGSHAPVIAGVRRAPLSSSGIAWFAVSDNGTLAYVPGSVTLSSSQLDIGLVDRKGTVTALGLPPAMYEYPRISSDGRRIAVGMDDGRQASILIHDREAPGAVQRFTFGGKNRYPIWSGDGRRVVFQSDREGDLGIFWQIADGSSVAERLTTAATGESHIAESWQPRGDVLLYSVVKGSDASLWMYSVRERKSAPFGGVRSETPIDATFSPDGKWVAYSSGTPVEVTVYVQPFPATGAMYQLVRRGSDVPHHPIWSQGGKELIVNSRPPDLDAVPVTKDPRFAFGTPTTLPKAFVTGPPAVRRPFDLAPDGRIVGLIMPGNEAATALTQVNVVLNWFEELKARVPGR